MGALEPRWAVPLGWALVHSLWQCALVALAARFLLRATRRSDLRHLLCCGALALCLALPCATAMRAGTAAPDRGSEVSAPLWLTPQAVAASSPPLSAWERLEAAIRPWLPAAVRAWALGCALAVLRLAGGWAVAERWRRRCGPAPAPWPGRVHALGWRVHLRRPVRLLSSTELATPLTLGLWRPAVLVPAALFTGMAPDLLEALLLHELAHVQRRDYLSNLLQSIVGAVLFYHPAVWWLSRQARTERELLADELAAGASGEPRRLALALRALGELPTVVIPAVPAGGGHLVNRIRRLLHPAPLARRALPGWPAPLLLSVALLAPAALAAPEAEGMVYAPAERVQRIDRLAVQEQIDLDLLRALAWVESRCDPSTVSARGARGLLQVMPETARQLGADSEDPDQAAAAGARYLRTLLDRYAGDWRRAVSAYEAGPAAVDGGGVGPETSVHVAEVLRLARAHAVQPDVFPPSTPSGLPLHGAKVTLGYGPARLPDALRLAIDFHQGIDLAAAERTPVLATADGTVTAAGPAGDRGITVVLNHGRGLETVYAHLAEARVLPGQRVGAGSVIGTVGSTGKSTGPHVHYELRMGGRPVDPTATVPE